MNAFVHFKALFYIEQYFGSSIQKTGKDWAHPGKVIPGAAHRLDSIWKPSPKGEVQKERR